MRELLNHPQNVIAPNHRVPRSMPLALSGSHSSSVSSTVTRNFRYMRCVRFDRCPDLVTREIFSSNGSIAIKLSVFDDYSSWYNDFGCDTLVPAASGRVK